MNVVVFQAEDLPRLTRLSLHFFSGPAIIPQHNEKPNKHIRNFCGPSSNLTIVRRPGIVVNPLQHFAVLSRCYFWSSFTYVVPKRRPVPILLILVGWTNQYLEGSLWSVDGCVPMLPSTVSADYRPSAGHTQRVWLRVREASNFSPFANHNAPVPHLTKPFKTPSKACTWATLRLH